MAQADLGARQFRKSASGSLTIVASWLTGTYLLPQLIAEFGHLHPAARISLELGTAAQAVERLRSHRAELGFIAGAVGGPEIEVERLLEYEVVIVGQPGLVSDPTSRDDIEVLTWISREEGSATRSASDAAMARLGIVPRRRLELPSYEAVVCAVKEGYGVAAIAHYLVATELRTGLLTVVPVRGWDVRAVVSALRVREALLSPAAEQFKALVRKRFAEMSHRGTKR